MAFSAQRCLMAKQLPPVFSFVERTQPGTSGTQARAIAVDNSGIFVSLGTRPGSGDMYAISSPDGQIWTERTTPYSGSNDSINACIFGDDRFYAVGAGAASGDEFCITAQGEGNWSDRPTMPNTGAFVNAIAYKPDGTSIFAMFALSNIYSSPTAETWTSRITPSGPISRMLTYGGGNFCWGGLNLSADEIATSPDAINWTARAIPNSASQTVEDFAYSTELGLWVGVGPTESGNDAYLITAPDPTSTWTERANSITHSGRFNGVTNIPSFGFIAVGSQVVSSSHRARIFTSPDGITWTEQTDHPFRNTDDTWYYRVEEHQGRIVIVGENPTLATDSFLVSN